MEVEEKVIGPSEEGPRASDCFLCGIGLIGGDEEADVASWVGSVGDEDDGSAVALSRDSEGSGRCSSSCEAPAVVSSWCCGCFPSRRCSSSISTGDEALGIGSWAGESEEAAAGAAMAGASISRMISTNR